MKLDKIVNGVRLQLESGTKDPAAHKECLRLWDRLVAQGRQDLLSLVKARTVTLYQLLLREKMGRMDATVSEVRLDQNLWETVAEVFAGEEPGMKRYRNSMLQFHGRKVLPASATVRDLAGVDWAALEKTWGNSPADWNHLRRAIGRLLSLVLRNRHHPFRMELLFAFPTRTEEARCPDIDVAKLALIEEPRVRDIVTFLATFGLRCGEYWRLTPAHYVNGVLSVPGTKTASAKRRMKIPAELDGFVRRMIPAPLSYVHTSLLWRAERERIGLTDVRLHDLRHLFGQLSAETVSLRTLADLMGHANVQQTYKYASRPATEVPVPAFLVTTPDPEVPLVH